MHCEIGVTCVYNGYLFYTLVITRQSNPPSSQFHSPCNDFTSFWSICVYNACIFVSTVSNIQLCKHPSGTYVNSSYTCFQYPVMQASFWNIRQFILQLFQLSSYASILLEHTLIHLTSVSNIQLCKHPSGTYVNSSYNCFRYPVMQASFWNIR